MRVHTECNCAPAPRIPENMLPVQFHPLHGRYHKEYQGTILRVHGRVPQVCPLCPRLGDFLRRCLRDAVRDACCPRPVRRAERRVTVEVPRSGISHGLEDVEWDPVVWRGAGAGWV
jgi:hypothetical protein